MAFKAISCMFLLLFLHAACWTPCSQAEENSAGANGSPGSIPEAGEAVWNRDLFAIFRTGPAGKDNGRPVERKKDGKRKAEKAEQIGDLQLQGIVVSNGAYAALADGRIVRPGEKVSGWRVRRIDRHSLQAEGPGGVRKYEILPGGAGARVSSTTPEQ